MQCGKWTVGSVLCGWVLVMVSGCVSLDEHRRLQAKHRNVLAEKVVLAQELYDMRNGSGSLHARADSLERELATKDELVSNLRSENELLEKMRSMYQSQIAELADKQHLGDIAIVGPKLPQQLDNALKRFADEHPSAVEYDAARGTVKWKSDLLFALGSDVVKQTSMETLKSFAEVIKSPPAAGFEVIVVGHTDNRPISRAATRATHPTNWHLSAHRAISVARVLRKFDYAPKRIGVMGFGEYRTVAPNTTEEGRTRNRRVEIYLVPTGSIVQPSVGLLRQKGREALALAMRPLSCGS